MNWISSRLVLIVCATIIALHADPVSAQRIATASSTQRGSQRQKQYRPGDIYLKASHVYALVGKTGLGHEHGVVGSLESGTLHLGASEHAGKMVFDMTTFVADSDAARKYVGLEGTSSASTKKQVTENMLGPNVLNVAKFPTAIFHVNSAEPYAKQSKHGLPQYMLKGEFTLQETTRPLEFLVEVELIKGWQHVRGGFQINQTDFGIKPFTKAFGAVGVADQLTIWGDAWVAPDAASSR